VRDARNVSAKPPQRQFGGWVGHLSQAATELTTGMHSFEEVGFLSCGRPNHSPKDLSSLVGLAHLACLLDAIREPGLVESLDGIRVSDETNSCLHIWPFASGGTNAGSSSIKALQVQINVSWAADGLAIIAVPSSKTTWEIACFAA
jgi:hypothetical protein